MAIRRRLDSVARALDALSPEEREAFFERRPDIETVLDIRRRHDDLRRAGLPFVDTDLFTSGLAIHVVENPDNRRFIDDMARRYGVDPALLEGVIASEIDFDRDRKDVILDNLGRKGIGIGIGQGWGVAAVHGDTLDKAIDYSGRTVCRARTTPGDTTRTSRTRPASRVRWRPRPSWSPSTPM